MALKPPIARPLAGRLKTANQATTGMPRTIASAPGVGKKVQTHERVWIATLVRGKTYAYKDDFFYLDKPRIVSADLAVILKDLKTQELVQGEEYDAYLFDVVHDFAPADIENDENERPARNVLPVPKRPSFERNNFRR